MPQFNEYVPGVGIGEGGGPEAAPNATALVFGSTASGTLRAQGWLDQIESYNGIPFARRDPLGLISFGTKLPYWGTLRETETRREQVFWATAEAGGLRLQWVRAWEGDPAKVPGNYKVERRELPSGGWETVGNVVHSRVLDPVVTSGTGGVREGKYFEYRVNRSGQPPATTVATWKGAPFDRHGRAILIVDQTVVDTSKPKHIANELAAYKQELVRDGWEVVQQNVPRHQDMAYVSQGNCTDYQTVRIPQNKAHAAEIKSLIQSQLLANEVNVVFLIGHVTIPYSGQLAPEDGHNGYDNPNDPGHPGAWPADAWYGCFAPTRNCSNPQDTGVGKWSDCSNLQGSSHWEWCWNVNSINDGRWNQNTLPGPLTVPIGRIDFHLMAPYKTTTETMHNGQDDTEIRLLKQYLDKVSRYRRGLIVPTGDFKAWDAIRRARPTIQRLAAHRWGLDGLDVARFSEDSFVPGSTVLWAAHTANGWWNQIGTELALEDPHRHVADEVADPDKNEHSRAMFLLLAGSYMGEWFRRDDDFLRTCLALPDTVMFVSYIDKPKTVWRMDRFSAGYPLYSVLKDTYDANPSASCRTTVLLGDPFLRERYLAPVAWVSVATQGSNKVVSWAAQPAAMAGYRIYRAPAAGSTTWTWVGDANAGATSWTHIAPGPGSSIYMVKCKALQAGGYGSRQVVSLGVTSP